MKKWGIIGTGGRGFYGFACALARRADVALTALCDLNPLRVKAAADILEREAHVHPACFTDCREFLRSDVDVAVVTTPDCTHAEIAASVLASGKDVVLDKPMATSVGGCLRIRDALRASGKRLFLGFNLRYDPVCRRIKELVDAGSIGKVVMISNFDSYAGGKTYMARWNRHYDKSGGLFCHKGCHDFDVMNWYLGMPRPQRVSAFAGVDVLTPANLPFAADPRDVGPYCRVCRCASLCPDFCPSASPLFARDVAAEDGYYPDTCIYLSEKDTHDNAVAIVEYEGGMRVSHWECFFTPVSTRRFTLVGTLGHLEADLSESRITVFPRWTRDRTTHSVDRAAGGHGGADPAMIEALVRNLEDFEGSDFPSLREGIRSVAIAQAAEISRRENRMVEISELISDEDLA